MVHVRARADDAVQADDARCFEEERSRVPPGGRLVLFSQPANFYKRRDHNTMPPPLKESHLITLELGKYHRGTSSISDLLSGKYLPSRVGSIESTAAASRSTPCSFHFTTPVRKGRERHERCMGWANGGHG
jgi:hypothetical protein